MKYILTFLFALSIFIACKKPSIKEVNTNNSVDSLTYQPKVPGSNWKYKLSMNGIVTSEYNTTRLSHDTSLNGKTYNVFNSEAEGRQYIRQEGDKYYTVLTTSTNKTELLLIDVAKNVGESWVGGINGSDTYTYTMKEKHSAYTLDGFNFKNVLVITQKRTNGSGATTLESDSYYAQGVGLVKSTGTLLGQPTILQLIAVNLK